MHRLIVNPETANAWEIPLAPGVTSLGRGPENNALLDHPSVADAHCRITVTNAGILIKDLGSGATFVDERAVDETVLLPGQTVRLGDVVMRFEAGADRPPPIALPVNARCGIHRRSAARYICPQCEGTFCELCVSTRPVEGQATPFCRKCSAECTPLPPPALEEPAPAGFLRELRGAFAYPFNGDGKVVLVAGTMIFLILDVVSRFSSIFAIVIGVFMLGFLICHLERILAGSAEGENEVPDLPDISNLDDLSSPMLQFLAPFALCFGPSILLEILAGVEVIDAARSPWFGYALLGTNLLGCVVFPMAFLAVTVFNSLGALNPLLIVPAILKIPLEYLFVVILLACGVGLLTVVLMAGVFGSSLLSRFIPIPFLPTIIASFAMIYFLSVDMRILGILYWTRKEKLGWFE